MIPIPISSDGDARKATLMHIREIAQKKWGYIPSCRKALNEARRWIQSGTGDSFMFARSEYSNTISISMDATKYNALYAVGQDPRLYALLEVMAEHGWYLNNVSNSDDLIVMEYEQVPERIR